MKKIPGTEEVPGEKSTATVRREESSLPSGVEEVHGGGTSKRDAYVRHGKFCEIRYSSSAH